MESNEPQPETRATLHALLSLTERKYSGFTLKDLKTFMECEVYTKYGAKTFLTNLGLTMKAPLLNRSIDDNIRSVLWAIELLAIRADFKPYYASSGILQAVREVFDDSRVRALSPDPQWLVYEDVIDIFE